MGLAGLLIPFVSVTVVMLAARFGAAVALGIDARWYRPGPVTHGWHHLVIVVVGLAAAYAVPAAMFIIARGAGGRVATSGERVPVVWVVAGFPAEAAGMKDGDEIMAIRGVAVNTWADMPPLLRPAAATEVPIEVERDGVRRKLVVKVSNQGLIGVESQVQRIEVGWGEAVAYGVTRPVGVAVNIVEGLSRWVTGTLDPELGGSAMIVKESSRAAERSIYDWLELLAVLTTYFGGPLAVVLTVVLHPKRSA